MAASAKRWQLPPPVKAHTLPANLPPPAVQILLSRGIDSSQKLRLFLDPPHHLPHNPMRLPDMDRALRRLYQAIHRQETVGIFGDFDVDGVTGTAIVAEGLSSMGVQVVPYLPQRVGEGHGLSDTAVQHLADQGASLIITVDCGVTAVAEVSQAQRLGVDVIITDHHLPPNTLPEATAVVNPRLPGASYPFPELCGAGLAFKLIQGLSQFCGQPWQPNLLELAALATIADLVPLVDENRYLVREGLRSLAQTARPGLQALYRRAGVDPKFLNAQTVAFQISPRLNAAGRMSHAMDSYRLLTTQSMAEAESLADRLDALNRERRALSEEAFTVACEQVQRQAALGEVPPILLVWDDCITPGIAGLVAGRLVDLFHRPAVVMAADGDNLVASGRSIPEFNMVEAFAACQELFLRYGGHAQAAGFTLPRDKLPLLTEGLSAFAEETLGFHDLTPALNIDAEAGMGDLTDDLILWLQSMEPYGPANREPVFFAPCVEVQASHFIGQGGQHLRLRVGKGTISWTALAFNQADKWVGETPYLDLVYSLMPDRYQGAGSWALRVLDFRVAGD